MVDGETAAVFLTILVLYFILALLMSLLMNWLERRFALDRHAKAFQARPLVKAGVPT